MTAQADETVFAADAHARVNGIAALITSYGSHETTANQVLFHAHAEHAQIVHIVAYPAIGQDEDRFTLRRLLRQGQVSSIDQAVAYNSVVVLGVFEHVSFAAKRIDDALSDCMFSRRPVYIGVPMIYADTLVEERRLVTGLCWRAPDFDSRKAQHVAEVILRYVDSAKDPVIIVDGGVIRQRLQNEVRQFVVRSGLPTFVTLQGKHAIDADLPNHAGLYAGLQSAPGINERVNASDLVIHIGPVRSHINTTRYLHYLEFRNKVEINIDDHLVGRTVSYGLRAKPLIKALLSRLHEVNLSPGAILPNQGVGDPIDCITLGDDDDSITMSHFHLRMLKSMQDGDILINHLPLPDIENWVHHTIWERRDVAYGACLGTCTASHLQSSGRVLVFADEEYHQRAFLELAPILTLGLRPIVYVLSPHGGKNANKYRFICRDGSQIKEPESDDYDENEEILAGFGRDAFGFNLRSHGRYEMYAVRDKRLLEELLASDEFLSPSCLQVCCATYFGLFMVGRLTL